MKQVEILGGCMCGQIRYSLTCDPIYATMCHCSDCRRSCGAQAVAWITVPDRNFSFTQGEPNRFASSPNVERTFCPKCGTSLTYKIDRRKNEIDITTGSLDNPEAYPPTQDYYCRDRLPWVKACTENQKE
ncbi:GFA family protein [Planctomycetota bacterium]